MTASNESINLRREVPANIVRWANLESATNELLDTFENWEQKNAELVNKFLEQPYFSGEESLIQTLIDKDANIAFSDIKHEWINLAIPQYNKQAWALKNCLDKTNDEFKRAFIAEIYDKVRTEIWWVPWWAAPPAPYDHFDTDCALPWDTNVLSYYQRVVNYLNWKEGVDPHTKAVDILKNVIITNEDLNWRLAIPLNDADRLSAIPVDKKNAFDSLLSFEIWKEADRVVTISRDIWKQFQWLSTNSFPAINTIVWEDNDYKYDESKLWPEYQWRLQTIINNTNLSEEERKKQINDLKWEYYLKYLKNKNAKIWNALEQLYNNNFDYSKLDRSVLKDYLDKVADIRLRMLFEEWLNEIIKLNWWNVDEFKKFYKNLADVDPSNPILNLTLYDVTIPWATPPMPLTWSLNIPIQKKLVGWENLWLKDIEQFWKNAEKSFDALPIEFTINRSDIENNPNLTIEDKTKISNLLSSFYQSDWDKYVITWENVWSLIYLFFAINNRNPITELDPSEQKRIESLFGQAKNHKNKPEDAETWHKTSNLDDFKTEIEKLWPWKFENWSEIWVPVWSSEIPWWWYQWMKIKISDIDASKWTFKWTFFGWELKFDSKFEWKSREFEISKDTVEELKKKSKSWKVLLLPNPDKSDFNSFRKLLKDQFSFPSAWTTRDNDKFMQKVTDEKWNEKDVKVKYFSAPWDDSSVYEIEYNPIRKSFTVSSKFNWDEKWKDWKSEKKRFTYKRDMDWNNFLIFFTQKWLVPQSEEEAKGAIMRQYNDFKIVNGGKWKLNWFSFNNIRHWLKDIFWAIKKKMDDYDKKQDEKFKKSVESGILGAIWSIPLLPPSLKGAIWERQQEIYNEKFNEAWTEIEWYLKALQSDEQFADTFDQVPPHVQTLYWKSYKKFITDLYYKKWETSTTEKRKAAALLLANIQKWSSPYRGLSWEENSWLWVKVILGNLHYGQFLRDKQKCIHDLKNAWKEKDQIQDVLATCEMDYIMNNVNWANWKLKYFGSHEWRWIPGNEDNTNYKPNPSKILLSEKFSKELKNAYQWWFNKSSVEEAFGKISHNDFNLAKEDFKRLIKSSRFPWAVANLKKMFMLAKNDQQQSEYQKCFLLYMLSGVLDVNGKKDLRKQTYQWAKTMWFLPGMLAKETSHSEKVVALLDDFCEEKWYWKFSNIVKSYFHEWDLKDWKLKIDQLIGELNSRWDVNKMKDFENYCKSIFPSKAFSHSTVLKKLQSDALDSGMENIDNSLLDNPVVANSGWLLSNANVVRDRMAIKDGAFDWKDPDERNNRAEFWNKIAEEVSNMNTDSPESVSLVLKQYFSRFGLNSEADRQKAYKRITTAYYWKSKIGKKFTYNYNGKWQPLDMGIVTEEEIKDILWYTFQWTVRKDCFSSRKLPPEMENALKKFQTFFEDAFERWMLDDPLVVKDAFKADWIKTEPMLLWSRNYYKDVFAWDWEFEYDTTEIWDEVDAFKDPKKRRKAQKRAFQSWRFINYEIAQIEKSFKNRLPSESYRPVTQDTSSDIETRINWLNAA